VRGRAAPPLGGSQGSRASLRNRGGHAADGRRFPLPRLKSGGSERTPPDHARLTRTRGGGRVRSHGTPISPALRTNAKKR
jgi:hypothetical protein